MSSVRKLEPSEVVTVGAGLLAFFSSFLPWIDYDIAGAEANAWEEPLFPTFTWIAIAGLLAALLTLLPIVSSVRIPRTIAGFTLRQVQVVLAGLALLLSISFLIGFEEHGAGFWLALLASIAMFVSALMQKERPAAAAGGVYDETSGI